MLLINKRQTRQSNNLFIKLYKTTGEQRSLKYIGVKLWNTIGYSIINAPSLYTLKRLYTTDKNEVLLSYAH